MIPQYNPWQYRFGNCEFLVKILILHEIFCIWPPLPTPTPWGWRVGKYDFSMQILTFHAVPSKKDFFLELNPHPTRIGVLGWQTWFSVQILTFLAISNKMKFCYLITNPYSYPHKGGKLVHMTFLLRFGNFIQFLGKKTFWKIYPLPSEDGGLAHMTVKIWTFHSILKLYTHVYIHNANVNEAPSDSRIFYIWQLHFFKFRKTILILFYAWISFSINLS